MTKKYITWGLAAAVGIGLLAGAYGLGRSSAEGSRYDLQDEIESLEKTADEAAVTKRVSEQMEQIAYQQKAISDKQRDRAEQQSALATLAANEAKKQSQLATEAAHKAEEQSVRATQESERAKAAAHEAEIQKASAQASQKVAEEREAEATFAKSISDTLNYRALGKSLGTSASTQFDSGHKDIAYGLAYLSWYFLDKYCSNTYQTETYKALASCTGSNRSVALHRSGAVNSMTRMSDGSVVAVSEYGDIEQFSSIGRQGKVLLQNTAYNFKDVYGQGTKVYALSIDGQLVVTDTKNAGQPQVITLPEDRYSKILPLTDNCLMLLGKKAVTLQSIRDNSLLRIEVGSEISTAILKGETAGIFLKNGKYAEISKDGTVTARKAPVTGKVTAVLHDEASGCTFYGLENGNIQIVNKTGTPVATLFGHKSRVTSLECAGDILITSAYDKATYIWNLPMLYLDNHVSYKEAVAATQQGAGSLERQGAGSREQGAGSKEQGASSREQGAPSTSSGTGSKGLEPEWLNPAVCSYDNWPLCMCEYNSQYVMVGMSNGVVRWVNMSVDGMAAQLKKSMARGLTQTEWNQYVGASIPYVKVK